MKKIVIRIAASIVAVILLVCLPRIGKRINAPAKEAQQESVCLLSDSDVYTIFDDICNAAPKNMDWLQDENTIEYGVLNDKTAVSESDTKISLESGEKYHRYIDLEQHIEEKGAYTLVVFDNFKQISVPLTIGHLEDGYHRLVFIWLCGVNRFFEKEELEEGGYLTACCTWSDVEVGTSQWQPECVSYEGEYFQECSMLVNLQSQYGVDNRVENIMYPESDDKGNYCMYTQVQKNQFISQGIPFGEKTDKSYS